MQVTPQIAPQTKKLGSEIRSGGRKSRFDVEMRSEGGLLLDVLRV
jgi:hypothetical protein